MPGNPHYKTVVISDVHLGAKHSKLHDVTSFLNSVDCDKLILAGDIIDGWQLGRQDDEWDVQKASFFSVIMKKIEKKGTDVIYVTGNHDDFLFPIAPCELFKIKIVNEYLLEDGFKRYVVIHGHAFDTISLRFKWLAKLGDLAYNLLLSLTYAWNRAREKSGKGYFSMAKYLKNEVKKAVNVISGFESDLSSYAKARKCDGIICGHIHRPEDKMLKGGVRYLNCGDWVESRTALLEDSEGNWTIFEYCK